MPAYLLKEKLVKYITSEGIKRSKIVSMTKFGEKVYYRLENGDYVADMQIGFVMAFENGELQKAF